MPTYLSCEGDIDTSTSSGVERYTCSTEFVDVTGNILITDTEMLEYYDFVFWAALFFACVMGFSRGVEG
jgi:hypothetical protein